ncbi:MAG TPA: serine/threonine protein kinase [Blastocatellia bacterium]|nr:serine/threonine protein kinase [Blastocatellia bacterium]
MPELRLENSIVDDRYLVDRCLGRGSYAEIFLAYDQGRRDEAVIIKALNVTLQGSVDAELEETLIENFQNEAIALDKVRHPNIIRRLGHGTAADLEGVPFHYLLLEYMPGGDLLTLCRNRPIGLDRVLLYFQQVAEALAYAHSQRVIHRDIKPNNLLLSGDNRLVKIADFGVAKMTHDDSVEITRVGTNVFAPPEHHPDTTTDDLNEKLTPSADVYSLAKTIYTTMTGRAPRQFARLPITELPVELANEPWAGALLDVLRKATEPRVADRYQSVQEFWSEFVSVKLSRGTNAQAAEDPDATIVRARARLKGISEVAQAAAKPNFQALAVAQVENGRPQKARIVVELQQHAEPNVVSSYDSRSAEPRPGTPPAVAGLNNVQVTAPSSVTEARASSAGTKRFDDDGVRAGGRPYSLKAFVTSEWLRRVFIVFLAAALIGLVASTYYYFAERKGMPAIFERLVAREGSIAGADNVNLRSEPRGSVLVTLAAGTRVRALEDRGGWVRVRVLEWPGAPPDNSTDAGWVDGRFIRFD